MRTPIVAANWKMNTTLAEALALVDELTPRLQALETVERVLCPPFPWLVPLRERLRGTGILLGAQNCHFEPKGAYTGEVSAPMLADLVDYVIVGHSERRQYFGETDEIISRKVQAVLGQGLKPILCVGENLAQNEAGETRQVIERQVCADLASVADPGGLVIAYEPVWAIGTGLTPTPADVAEVHKMIRNYLISKDKDQGQAVRILYGGSVKPQNAKELMAVANVNGALVGGASLKAADFLEIAAAYD